MNKRDNLYKYLHLSVTVTHMNRPGRERLLIMSVERAIFFECVYQSSLPIYSKIVFCYHFCICKFSVSLNYTW